MSIASQHKIIRPANRLHIKARISDLSVSQMMANAHRVMALIAQNYSQWLCADLGGLSRSFENLSAEPGNGDHRNDLFRISHDIRGQAASFDYDLASDIATSLCGFLERHEKIEEVQLKVVEAHISAIRAYLRQSLKGDGRSVGQELMAEISGLIQRTEAS